MKILGISCYYHDSSASLLKNGKIVAAAQEERFTRKKHDISFPKKAIEYCLESQNLKISDIDYIAFYEKPFLKFERLLYQHLDSFPKSYKLFLSMLPSWFNEKLRIIKTIKKELGYKNDVLFVDHHMSHAAGSFLPSPFETAAVLSVDGVGEWTTTTYGICSGNDIKLLKEIKFPSSLGLLYSTITAYLGMRVNNSEFKCMGLAAYGNMNKKTNPYYEKLMGVLDLKEDGSFRFDMSYFDYIHGNKMPSKKFCELMVGDIRIPDSEMTNRHKDVAAAVQLITEEIMIRMLNHVHKVTKMNNLVLSGGVALNSSLNGKILRNTKFKKIWIQPDPGDGGTSLGSALYVYNTIFGNKRSYRLKDAYLGPEYSYDEIKNFLKENKIKYSEFISDRDLVKKTAELINQSNVVGWFQGRMEWGPRALGARSILSNPANINMQEILNLKVKHRESFRPFAPVVCDNDALKYFECDKPIPESADYMLMVYPIKKKWHEKIPAVTHVDGSGRLQTIRRHQNPRYYDLIKEFGKKSGIPILINTSFNIRGEPIVCSPRDAYKCMMGTEIDYLIMDKFLIKRKDNPKDMWDSEKNVKD